jgi:hypothetical protein
MRSARRLRDAARRPFSSDSKRPPRGTAITRIMDAACFMRSELIFIIRRLSGYHLFPLALVIGLAGCVESISHDDVAAGKSAAEFAQVAFVKRDTEKGYALLSDSTKRYVSLEKFKEVISRMHPKAFPKSVTAIEYEPMPGEKAMYVFLEGENVGERFYYRLTMEGTAATGYRVLRLDRASSPYPSSDRKQRFSKSPSPSS